MPLLLENDRAHFFLPRCSSLECSLFQTHIDEQRYKSYLTRQFSISPSYPLNSPNDSPLISSIPDRIECKKEEEEREHEKGRVDQFCLLSVWAGLLIFMIFRTVALSCHESQWSLGLHTRSWLFPGSLLGFWPDNVEASDFWDCPVKRKTYTFLHMRVLLWRSVTVKSRCVHMCAHREVEEFSWGTA